MKRVRIWKMLLVAGVVACALGLAACSAGNPSGGVAAVVNGHDISEQTVTDQVQHIRDQSGLTDNDSWGKFLVQNDMTPQSVRQQIIDTLVEQEIIAEGAAELDISVEDSEIDEYVNSMKENYSTDEAWTKALEAAGFTEASYRDEIRQSLIEQKVSDYFEDKAEVTEEDYVTSAQTYASYYDGAKRSSHILISVDDTNDEEAMAAAQEKAADLKAQIDAGADFAALATENSDDTGSAENGGDVGWDKLNSFVDEYTEALGELELNQVSDPVTSQYGVHIIKCTEVFDAPEESSEITSLDQIPEAFQESIKEMAVSVKANSDYTEWLDGLKEKAETTVNDMPSGLPYDIDLTKYQEEADASAAADTSDTSDVTDSADTSDTSDADATAETTLDESATDATADVTAETAIEGTTSEESSSSASASSTSGESSSASESSASN